MAKTKKQRSIIEAVEVPEATQDLSEKVADEPTEELTSSTKTPGKKGHMKAFFASKKRRIIVIIAGVMIVLAAIFALPPSRYAIAGLVVKKDVQLVVIDSITKRPVTDSVVTVGNVTGKTDKNGKITLHSISAGQFTLKITKQYYGTYMGSYIVPILSRPSSPTIHLVAHGRQVVVRVVSTIDSTPLEGVKVESSSTSAVTSSNGIAIVILPVVHNTVTASLTKAGYNTATVTIDVNNPNAQNDYRLMPAGTVYYLSNITGTTNIMKSNLDGTNASIVVTGTGYESNSTTTLLATTDWQYMALLAVRQSDGKNRVYVLDGQTNTLKTIDQTADSYQFIGWSGHNFIYLASYTTSNFWDAGSQILKSYNADTGKIIQLDKTQGTGTNNYDYQYQYFSNFYIEGNVVVYITNWYVGQNSGAKTNSIQSVDVNGNKKNLKDIPGQGYISVTPYEAGSLYIAAFNGTTTNYYEYEDGSVKAITLTSQQYSNGYPTYYYSPSGDKTVWAEVRNGKNTIFVGDADGANGTQIDSLSDFKPFGWYGDQYIILSKDSVLYISSASKPITSTYSPLKIGSYQPTSNNYGGYGSGYGGA